MNTSFEEVLIDKEEHKLVGVEYGKKLEARRWLILISFALFSASTATTWVLYTGIMPQAQTFFSVSANDIVQFVNSANYVYFAFSFLNAYLCYKYFAFTIFGCMLLNAFGDWLKYFADTDYTMALIGQYLSCTSGTIVLFVPVLIADRWFPANERMWAVSIGSMSNMIGWAIGYITPTLVLGNTPDGDHDKIRMITLYEAIFSVIPVIIGAFSLRDKPLVPPSYSAFVKANDHSSFWNEVLRALKDPKFLMVALCFGNLAGQGYTISTVGPLLLTGLNTLQVGIVGITFIVTGIVTIIIGTEIVNRSNVENYDFVLKVFFVGTLLAFIGYALTIHMNNIYITTVLMGILGGGTLGFQPFACQTVVEITFPVQEAIAVNIMMMFVQIFSLIGNNLLDASFVGTQGAWVIVVFITPAVAYFVFVHKTVSKRREAEMKHKMVTAEDAKVLSKNNLEENQKRHSTDRVKVQDSFSVLTNDC